ncbi:arginine--tRNA ligase [Candidatus Woesearchaeota archaeon]|nr:arginine--tRNA ligase [Candidatus Woesearchaeota archaeon]
MDKFQEEIIKFLKKETKQEVNLEVPPNPELGDYAFPCFNLAKVLKKSPNEIAENLAIKFPKTFLIQEVKAVGPYVNFFINKNRLAGDILKKIIKEKNRYGSSDSGKGKKIVVEHTSINPNASPHVGRARNAFIGDCIVRTLKFQGYNIETHYFINDIGKQIAMLVLGIRNKKNIRFEDLLKNYIEINKKFEKDTKLEKKVFDLMYKLEKGDKKVKADFKRIVDVCVKGQIKLFTELGIKYDKFDYESKYLFDKKTVAILRELERTGNLFIDKDNRWVLDQKGFELGMKVPVLVLTRGDGTSMYPLRDIAYTTEKVGLGHNIVVLGEDQKLYFEQISAALKIMGYATPEVVHYSFVLLEEGKMSTRKGNLVLLGDFMEEAVKKAKIEIKKRHGKADERSAKKIGYGAIKYSILRVSPEKNVVFNWQQALSFEGESAPYIQYAYARVCSILKKHNKRIDSKINYSLLDKKEETGLVKKLSEFPNIVNKMEADLRPHIIANYLYELAQRLNEFYHSCPILKENEDVKKARLLLITAVKQVLSNGLSLLGIETLEKM